MAVSQALTVTQESQSITNNTSVIRIKWTSTQSGASYNDYTRTGYYYVSVNGGTEKQYSVSYTLPKSSTKTIVNTTLTVSHNSSGACSVKVRTYMNTGISAGVVELSKSLTLDTIPRKSTLSVANGTLNTEQTLTVTRQSSSFTHTIVATCGDTSKTICTKSSSTSISFTPPLSWASQNTTGTSVSVTYKITTYNGDTSVGSNSYTKTCTIPDSVKPSCSIAVSDAMGYADTYGGYVQGKSKFKVVVTPTISYDSEIASYKVTANDSTYTSASFTTGIVNTSGDLSIKATVTDKRGRSGTASATATVLEYTNPVIEKLTVKRCDSDGTSNDQGEYAKVTYTGSVSSLNGKNTASFVLKYKKRSDSTYTSVNLSTDFSVTNGTYIFAADTGSSYDVTLVITDAFGTTDKNVPVSTATTIMHFNKSGTGIAFGKISEKEERIEMGWALQFANGKQIYGTRTDGTTIQILNYSTDDNTALGWGGYDQGVGSTNIYGDVINFRCNNGMTAQHYLQLAYNALQLRLKNPDSGAQISVGVGSGGSNRGIYDEVTGQWAFYMDENNDTNIGTSKNVSYRPYHRAGDSVSITIYTAGYVTSSSTIVYFTLPVNRPIINSPKVTAESVSGFILRQNGAYTHGSAASTFVSPDSYTATLRNGFITIYATFSTTTNAVNNAPIGVHWSGKITFS